MQIFWHQMSLSGRHIEREDTAKRRRFVRIDSNIKTDARIENHKGANASASRTIINQLSRVILITKLNTSNQLFNI